MSTFGIYLIGFIILIAALAYGASVIGVSSTWIGIGVAALLGVAILSGASRTRHKDPPDA